ncbi:DUF1772-domain-containing protein [Xylariaceae sp. FL0255]|nr:DUF1772-domain-containing protein [Xylariaceae sp. FL0255]
MQPMANWDYGVCSNIPLLAMLSNVNVGGVAAISGFFLTGAMMNIAILDVPVMLSVNKNSTALLSHWATLYEYGARLYPSISVTVGLLYLLAIISNGRLGRPLGVYLAAVATTLSMIPFTLIVMMPTNDKLMGARNLAVEDNVVVSLGEVDGLIGRWQMLHLLRCLFPLAGSLIGALGAFQMSVLLE